MELDRASAYDEAMKHVNVVPLLFLLLTCTSNCLSEDPEASEILAEVQGTKIVRSEVEAEASQALEQLDLERVQFEAQQVRKRHQAIERALAKLTSEKVVDLEAEARGISREDLIRQEADEKIEPPTEEEIEAYYERNKTRFKGEKEESLLHVKRILERGKRSKARTDLVESLKEKYGLESYLAPLRIEVESDGYPAIGPADAKVTIVEFSDFECPYCSRLAETTKKVAEAYSDDLRLVFRNFPLHRIHRNAQKASEAALCAGDQDKFWEMHDAMFADQKKLTVPNLKEKAASLELDTEAFNTCLDSGKYADAVKEDLFDGVRAGVTGTPALFINGRPYAGNLPFEQIAAIVEEELKPVN